MEQVSIHETGGDCYVFPLFDFSIESIAAARSIAGENLPQSLSRFFAKKKGKVPFKKGKRLRLNAATRTAKNGFLLEFSPDRAKNPFGFHSRDHTRKRRFVKVNMDEQPLAPSGTGRIYARCLSLKLKSTHNDIRAWSRRGLPGLIKLEPPRRILNLLSYVYHQFDPPGGRDESLRKICVTPTQRDIKVCYVPCPLPCTCA